LEEYKGIHLPPRSIILSFKKKLFAKIARRGKRDYTLLDLPFSVLFALGSKRDYTPREVTNPSSHTRDSIDPIDKTLFYLHCRYKIVALVYVKN
jgi:hypothetical protein